MPLDLLVRTPEFLTQRPELGDFFVREMLEQGNVIYEATHVGQDWIDKAEGDWISAQSERARMESNFSQDHLIRQRHFLAS